MALSHALAASTGQLPARFELAVVGENVVASVYDVGGSAASEV